MTSRWATWASWLTSDLGDFDMGAITDNLDLSSDEMLIAIADKIKLNPQFKNVAEATMHA